MDHLTIFSSFSIGFGKQNCGLTLMRIGLDLAVCAWHEMKLQTWHSFAKWNQIERQMVCQFVDFTSIYKEKRQRERNMSKLSIWKYVCGEKTWEEKCFSCVAHRRLRRAQANAQSRPISIQSGCPTGHYTLSGSPTSTSYQVIWGTWLHNTIHIM